MFREAENERVLTICSHSRLLNDTKSWLIKNRLGVLHTNREVNTGWKQMKFDFSVTNGNDLCLVLCRGIVDEASINRLVALIAEVDDLYHSGIKQDNLPFGVELILSDHQSHVSGHHLEQLKAYEWLRNVEMAHLWSSK